MSSQVFIEDIQILLSAGADHFGRPDRPQPALVTVHIDYDFSGASATDDFTQALDYRTVKKAVESISSNPHRSIRHAVEDLQSALEKILPETVARFDFRVVLPRALMHAEGMVCEVDVSRDKGLSGWEREQIRTTIDRLRVPCIIGIGKEERVIVQPVGITLALGYHTPEVVKTIGAALFTEIGKTQFQTIEALIEVVCDIALKSISVEDGYTMDIKVTKLSVFASAAGPGVRIFRSQPGPLTI